MIVKVLSVLAVTSAVYGGFGGHDFGGGSEGHFGGGKSHINFIHHHGGFEHEFEHKQEEHEKHEIDYHAHPKYEFKYGVDDHKTGDHHEQKEERDGDKVTGEYSLKEPDGTIRTVKYTADKHSGFNAIVIRSGHAHHPETIEKKHEEIHHHGGHHHFGHHF